MTPQLTTDSDLDFFSSNPLPTVSLHGEEAGADGSPAAAVPMEVAAEAEPPKTEVQETLYWLCVMCRAVEPSQDSVSSLKSIQLAIWSNPIYTQFFVASLVLCCWLCVVSLS